MKRPYGLIANEEWLNCCEEVDMVGLLDSFLSKFLVRSCGELVRGRGAPRCVSWSVNEDVVLVFDSFASQPA
jgi:hypothetical protein